MVNTFTTVDNVGVTTQVMLDASSIQSDSQLSGVKGEWFLSRLLCWAVPEVAVGSYSVTRASPYWHALLVGDSDSVGAGYENTSPTFDIFSSALIEQAHRFLGIRYCTAPEDSIVNAQELNNGVLIWDLQGLNLNFREGQAIYYLIGQTSLWPYQNGDEITYSIYMRTLWQRRRQ